MYDCSLITTVNDSDFEAVYYNNQATIDKNMGFTNTVYDTDEKKIDMMKTYFNHNTEESVLVKIVRQSNGEVVGYLKGHNHGDTFEITNAVFMNNVMGGFGNGFYIDTHAFWKTLGFKYIEACLVKEAEGVVAFTRGACYKPDFFRYVSEREHPMAHHENVPDCIIVKLEIL